MKKSSKGFTLVELLAVIVILAIIMIIAIPAVLETLDAARRKAFIEYVNKVSSLSQKQLSEDQMLGSKSLTECVVYNVKTGLDLNNTGDFDGWILINPNKSDIYVTLYNDELVLIGFHYSDSSLKIDDYIQKKTSENVSKLTVEELCKSSSCLSCNYDGTSVDGKETGKDIYVVSGEHMFVGRELPEDVEARSTAAQAMEDWRIFLMPSSSIPQLYLKHKILNNIITETYVEFIITPEMVNNNSAMKAGTYTLRGGIDESSLTNKPIYEANKAVLINAFGTSNCSEYDNHFSCEAAGIDVYAEPNGVVQALTVGTESYFCGAIYEVFTCGPSW